ncbi:DUF2269 domain-containing protein [Actinokineospora soli]|uniref:DUF2269 domain-containing protein n=1 Tax=Actinokineospora soli TaxID=1048753 RepID=A0ABW2TTX6_9PSEU
MPPPARKLALLAHVVSSVGWLGAVVVFLALAVVGANAEDAQVARAAVLVMPSITWWALVPLAVASLVTGVVCSLSTTWGLFRHYWVVIKLALNVVATTVLLFYTRTVDRLAERAADPALTGDRLRALAASPVLHAALALLVLLAATVLAVYKPKGLTRHGWRAQRRARRA